MFFNDFKTMLEKNLSAYETFVVRATEYQEMKNKNRQPAKRWDQQKIERAVNDMWLQTAHNIYDKVKSKAPKKAVDIDAAWDEFMRDNEIYDSLEESMSEVEFE